jgi:hypothetical protein
MQIGGSMAGWRVLRKGVALASAVAMCGTLLGCGGGSDGGSNPMGSSPPPPQRRLVTNGTFELTDPNTASAVSGGVLNVDFFVVPFNVNASGTLEASVNWTFAANDIDIVIVQGNCTIDLVIADACGAELAVGVTLAKPETARATVSSGPHTLVIINLGPGSESGTFEVFLTS